VIVCPTQAIIAGDLDNPSSKASRMVATEKVSVRKPQKGTEPKLYYLGIEGDLLQPTRLSHQNTYMFAEQRDQRPSSSGFDPAVTREVYDVAHPAPWGWKIAAYLWTKSIAAGVLLMAAIYMGLSTTVNGQLLNVLSPLIALAALAVTSALLIFDLKRPDRFFYLLTKPNFRSWLVIGGYILIGYGGLSSTWLLLGVLGQTIPGALVFTTALLASATACYSAFLFAQAKGRDLWQSPMFFWHLLMHALIAGSATLALVGFVTNHLILMNDSVQILVPFLVISLLMVLAEVALPHVSIDSQLAMRALIRGHLRMRFWGLVVGAGLVLPIVLGIFSAWDSIWTIPVPVLALAGVWWFQDLWVKAGQSVPLS